MLKLIGIIKLGVYKDLIPNNKLYKLILEKLEDIQVTGYHDSMYYMKRIAEHYGASYSTCVCSNKYLKDFAEAITGESYLENLPNKIYLHDIAEELGSLLEEDTENYYLMEIYELIDATQKTLTTLTINVPLNIVYSDEFNITGTLIDEDNNPVTSASVNLLVGNTIVETNTTNNQGEVSFTRTPVHTGNHSFQLTYNGDITYKTSRSSIVERVIGKETSVLTLINPIDQSNHIVNTSVTISGTLLDDDGDPIPNASISLSTGETVTTGSNGSFITSHTFTSIMDDLSVIASYNGDDNYTSSTATRVINIIEEPPAYDGITLTGTQSILSYYDSDTCTLTAQVTNNGEAVAVPAIIVTFYDNDDTILDTALTDGTGKARYVYQSQGIGDIGIIASVGSISSETFGLTDARYYNDGSRVTGMQGTSGASITTDGEYVSLTATNSGEKQIGYGITYTSSDNWEISCIIDYANSVGHAYSFVLSSSSSLGGSNNYFSLDIPSSSFYVKLDGGSARTYQRTFATGDKITLRRLNGDWILLHNDDEVWKGSYSWSGNRMICHYVTSARTIKIKDIVIKPL